MGKIFKIIFVTALTLMVLLILIAAFIFWYAFYDVSGLDLYKDEPISEIIPCGKRVYLITEDGHGYVMGGYDPDSSRMYLNSEFHKNEKLGIVVSPVRFTDEKIKQLFPYSDRVLFITDSNNLYLAIDENSEYLCENIIYADHATWRADEIIYAVDTSNNLYSISKQRESVLLCNNVEIVKAYRDRVFVLCTNGDLCELQKTNSNEYILSEPLYKNVADFDVLDTSTRHDGEKLVYDDATAINTPLFNVLTENGELYVKGFYNLLCCSRGLGESPEPVEYKEWSLISENVSSFDLSYMGTVFVRKDTSCAYYGLVKVSQVYNSYEVVLEELFNDGAVSACTSKDNCIYVKTNENKYYMWGSWATISFVYYSENDALLQGNYNIVSGQPFVLEP